MAQRFIFSSGGQIGLRTESSEALPNELTFYETECGERLNLSVLLEIVGLFVRSENDKLKD